MPLRGTLTNSVRKRSVPEMLTVLKQLYDARGHFPSNLVKLTDEVRRAVTKGDARATVREAISLGEAVLSLLVDFAHSEYHKENPDNQIHGRAAREADGTRVGLLRQYYNGLSGSSALKSNWKPQDTREAREFVLFWKNATRKAKEPTYAHEGLAVFEDLVKKYDGALQEAKPDPFFEFLSSLVEARNVMSHQADYFTGKSGKPHFKPASQFDGVMARVFAPAVLDFSVGIIPLVRAFPRARIAGVKQVDDQWQLTVNVRCTDSPEFEISAPRTDEGYKKNEDVYFDAASMRVAFRQIDDTVVKQPRPTDDGSATKQHGGGKLDHLKRTEPHLRDILRAIENGYFTPVLGPGCFRVASNVRLGAAHVAPRLKLVRNNISDDEDAQAYLTSIVSSRLGDDAYFPAIPIAHEGTQLEDFERHELLSLQLCLLKLGVAAARAFGSSLHAHPLGFTDLSELTVEVDKGQEECANEIRGLFRVAKEAAKELANAPVLQGRSRALGLGSAGIERQFQSQAWVVAKKDPLRIPITFLEWIGDLLWHTLRFRSPMYPAPDELAFQLSVCLPSSEGDTIVRHKPHVGTIASRLDGADGEVVEILGPWAKEWQKGHRRIPAEGFHATLVKALLRYQAPDISTEVHADVSTNLASNFVRNHAQRPRIALETGFDCGLEEAVRKRKIAFHLTFPVHLDYLDCQGAANQADAWLVCSDDGLGGLSWRLLTGLNSPSGAAGGARGLSNGFRFEGPMIVKLHGAPLAPLPGPEVLRSLGSESGIDVRGLTHRVLLADSDVFRVLRSENDLPPGLSEILRMPTEVGRSAYPRVLCLLGFPLGDASSRLRVFQLKKPWCREDTAKESSPDIVLVDAPFDPVHHAFLSVHKTLIKCSLDDFADEVSREMNS